jgi:hypothetical protein
MKKYKVVIPLLISMIIFTVFSSAPIMVNMTVAQAEEPWSEPINLSHSGSTTIHRL